LFHSCISKVSEEDANVIKFRISNVK